MKLFIWISIFTFITQTTFCQVEESFKVQFGLWQPIGKLNNTFYNSPSFGFNPTLPISDNLGVTVGGKVNYIINSEPYDYMKNDSTFKTSSSQTGNTIIGFWLVHENKISEKFYLDKNLGIGINNLITSTKKPNRKNNFYNVATINLSFEIGLWYISFIGPFGLFLNYNYSPYNLLSRVHKDFGNSSIAYGIQYNINFTK
ncbi:MAG: hypothetical protein PF489_01200 [Salinivirgaceae bacterium]|jgi:hypothetical protein|nr:hypothetical protein [Salinivirgaceae bacterium]